MKKKKTDFESRFWSGQKKHSALPLIDVFFQFYDLVAAKERLSLMIRYAAQKKTRIPEDPSAVFHFYQSMRSFVRAGYNLRKKTGKWELKVLPEKDTLLGRGLLSEEEYGDPVRVFRKAFKEYRPAQFLEFLAESVHFSLGTFNHAPEGKLIGPYLHLVKMLDAAWLIVERASAEK
ncbi:hypothetical protein [uncultured Chryseobacterium sp.]|uniref:hypothetical protein n=1 Tax=uncultured Chryseobacterium sp. TaxID=259322 RepID=UPI0025D1B2DE|nr:hypothetical protein [uncultured Chryseobacterium sp.]